MFYFITLLGRNMPICTVLFRDPWCIEKHVEGSQNIILQGIAVTAFPTVHDFVFPSKINKYLFFRMLVLNIFHVLCDTDMRFLLIQKNSKKQQCPRNFGNSQWSVGS